MPYKPARHHIAFALIILIASFTLVILPTFAQSTAEEIALALIAAEDAHDVDAAMALFADDAVVTLPTGVLDTPEAIRGWQEELAAGNFHIEAINIQADDNIVSWTGQISLDSFRYMGIASLDANWTLAIEDGKVTTFDFAFTPEAFTEIRAGSIALALIAAEDANDVDAAVALFADDAVVTLPTGVLDTPEAILAWQEELAAGNFRIESVGRSVHGNTVHWEGTVSLDVFRGLGLASLDAEWEIVVEDGKISTFDFAFTPEALEALQAAQAA